MSSNPLKTFGSPPYPIMKLSYQHQLVQSRPNRRNLLHQCKWDSPSNGLGQELLAISRILSVPWSDAECPWTTYAHQSTQYRRVPVSEVLTPFHRDFLRLPPPSSVGSFSQFSQHVDWSSQWAWNRRVVNSTVSSPEWWTSYLPLDVCTHQNFLIDFHSGWSWVLVHPKNFGKYWNESSSTPLDVHGVERVLEDFSVWPE